MRATGAWLSLPVKSGLVVQDSDWIKEQVAYGHYNTPQFAPSAAAQQVDIVLENYIQMNGMSYWYDGGGFLLVYELLQGRLKMRPVVGRASRPLPSA